MSCKTMIELNQGMLMMMSKFLVFFLLHYLHFLHTYYIHKIVNPPTGEYTFTTKAHILQKQTTRPKPVQK